MSNSFFKKMNHSGVGHQTLLILVGVLSVIGITGFFVWRGNDMSADAASRVVWSQTIDGKRVTIRACRVRGKNLVNVTYNRAGAKSLVGSKALIVGLSNEGDEDLALSNWVNNSITIKNYNPGRMTEPEYGGLGAFDAFFIPSGGVRLPANGGVMSVKVKDLPSC